MQLSNGVFLDVTQQIAMGLPGPVKINYDGSIEDEKTEIGEEKLLVRSLNLEHGAYAWVEFSEDVALKPLWQYEGVSFPFLVRSKEQSQLRESNLIIGRWQALSPPPCIAEFYKDGSWELFFEKNPSKKGHYNFLTKDKITIFDDVSKIEDVLKIEFHSEDTLILQGIPGETRATYSSEIKKFKRLK